MKSELWNKKAIDTGQNTEKNLQKNKNKDLLTSKTKIQIPRSVTGFRGLNWLGKPGHKKRKQTLKNVPSTALI